MIWKERNLGWPFGGIWARRLLIACACVRSHNAIDLPSPLDLEAFEDVDCLQSPSSEILLELMSELCDVVESILFSPSDEAGKWALFQQWSADRSALLLTLSGSIFAGPYCEPGKVASATAACLLMLGEQRGRAEHAQLPTCVEHVDLMLQATSRGERHAFDTRLHMFLRSPWPAFRLLDLMVRLHATDASRAAVDLGPCRANEDWLGNPVDFDWPWFKSALSEALEGATMDQALFALDPRDGPLSEQYRARWMRLYGKPLFRAAAAFGSAAFYHFRQNQWEAGCNPGIAASYIMQVVTFCIRDVEAWLQRYVGAAWRLVNLLAPVPRLIHSDWPLFRALHVGSLLRRHPAAWTPGRLHQDDRAGPMPAQLLQERIRVVLSPPPQVVYVTAVWGSFSPFVVPFISRWVALAIPLLMFLALDQGALSACRTADKAKAVVCIEAPQRFGVEATIAKYIALSVASQCGSFAVWLDFDVYLPADPTARLQAELVSVDPCPLAFSRSLTSQSLSPSVIAARGLEASRLLLTYAAWLYEHPYILDHQGWDSFLHNPQGDFSGSWDYKGRNITSAPNDGLRISFAPLLGSEGALASQTQYAVLDHAFASGDGLLVPPENLVAFHFWGADEPQDELFKVFYPFEAEGFNTEAQVLLERYIREPASGTVGSTAARVQPKAHVTSISYADGCCSKSIERNRRTAISVGVDVVHAYNRSDLDEHWAAKHAEILSQRKGGGWWLWKPQIILRTLQDDAVPWHTGVVLWLDAGNFYVGDPQPVIARALRNSDVAAMRLKCCMESDWTSARALRKLDGSGYVIADTPQLGAYFIIFRKTRNSLAFVEEWLRFAEDPEVLTDAGDSANLLEAPGFQRHMADQSIFSVLFKQHGFEALSLQEGHRVVQLDRWRE